MSDCGEKNVNDLVVHPVKNPRMKECPQTWVYGLLGRDHERQGVEKRVE